MFLVVGGVLFNPSSYIIVFTQLKYVGPEIIKVLAIKKEIQSSDNNFHWFLAL
jgi:hypothetical protein